jgi:predicted hotdog family 3-hydroxylacyl-ACP dehydratase
MIDKLIAFSADASTTETTVSASNIFVDNGYFSASGMMENIAQTCAARVGFYNKYVLHNEVQIGFIGAIRNYMIHELPAVGTVIHTKVDIIQDIFGMTLANATIVSGDKVFVTAEVKLSVKTV